jgi:hypothetical protein
MTSDLEKSFKAKLRAIAKEKKRDPGDLWQSLTIERFLVRLAHSKHREHFVLKGGILLSKYIELGRETTDLDFLARKLNNEATRLKEVFEEIANIDLKDGFVFKEIQVNELRHPHMGYPGVEVSMRAYFGKTRLKVAIDIGFGDIVEAVEYTIPLTAYSKGVLFESKVKLACYPKEFIFAAAGNWLWRACSCCSNAHRFFSGRGSSIINVNIITARTIIRVASINLSYDCKCMIV